MARTSRPLVERMTLVWHDWFATSNDGVGSQKLMLKQNKLFRAHALGSFRELLLDVTRDPAMLLWLNGTDNTRRSPNENYAREMMELFTLGAGRGYGESDVREQARALTGFRNDWSRGLGAHNFRFDRANHDPGRKRIFGHSGTFSWEDACNLCLRHGDHPSFFVRKLWSYFVPTVPDAATQRSLVKLYRTREVRPVVEAILRHPALYEGPRMTKPPAVLTAGMLRATGRGIDTDSWSWLGSLAGQQLFYPPNVAGWDDARWLDTATFLGRWDNVLTAVEKAKLNPSAPPAGLPSAPAALVDRALDFWGRPTLTGETHDLLLQFATRAMADANQSWKRTQYPPMVQNALRQLIAMSPDFQTG